MKATLRRSRHSGYRLVFLDRTLSFPVDWDFPMLASLFGLVPCEQCGTDGTVDCEHTTKEEMIEKATQYLDAHLDTMTNTTYFD